MKKTFKNIVLGAACAAAFGGAAFACHHEDISNNNVVKDARGNQVTDVRGNCIHTKWKDGSDKCNAAPAAEASGFTLNERTIYFSFDSDKLSPEGVYKLNRLLGKLATTSGKWNLTIVGHADKLGDAGYNQALSARRAEAVRKYLTAHGIKANIGSVTAEGKNAPVTEGCEKSDSRAGTIGCLQPDRRVEIKFTPGE